MDLTLANSKNEDCRKEISFLVDTGATRAWISQEVADELGIEPVGAVPLELADGSIKNYPYGFCLFNFEGETIAGNVVIGPSGCEPLVGTHVLQDFRVIIDMERHTISRGRAMRAKRVKGERNPFFTDGDIYDLRIGGRPRCLCHGQYVVSC